MSEPLTISPKSVQMRAYQSQAFEASGIEPSQPVEWSIEPKVGRINSNGVYTAPSWLTVGKRVTVTLSNAGRTASAEVEISAVVLWTLLLGLYWVGMAVSLFAIIVVRWQDLCPTCKTPEVAISPPLVTLTARQQQQFTANTPVNWAAPLLPTGLYPGSAQDVKADGTITVVATSIADPKKSGNAVIILSPDVGISLYPQSATVEASKLIDFSPVFSGPREKLEVEWLPPAAGKISPQGTYTAPPGEQVQSPRTIQIVARTKTQPARTAAANVTIVPPGHQECAESQWGLLVLIALLGAVGGLLHGASSFAIYVGNRQLRVSWTWWYLLKPVLGALLALVFYLAYRGFGGGELALASSDCIKVGGLAALIGLFSEQASVKLRDIFETLLTPKRDPRTDQAKPGGETPRISKVSPPSVKKGSEGADLVISGSNFATNCTVRINEGPARPAASTATTEIKVRLTKDDVASAGTLKLRVVNPTGETSDPFQLPITE